MTTSRRWRAGWLGLAALCATLCAPLGVAAQAPVPAARSAADCPPPLQPPTPDELQVAQRRARDRGALWRATRDGRSSYLFGTIHVGKLDWVMPGPQLSAALAATDTIALEIDLSDPQMGARFMAAGTGAPPPALPAPLAARLAHRLDTACLPSGTRPAVDAQHPVLKVMTLSVLEARWAGLEAGYAQEFALAGYGRAAQRRVVSLETPELQWATLVPQEADAVRELIASALDQLDAGAARRTIERLASAWERGDLGELERYERWCECVLDDTDRRLMRRLLDDRNPGLAARIEALHQEGRRVLAGVGALHMVGPQGLPALLRARGFTVERVPFLQ